MAVKIRTAEAPDVSKAEMNVQSIQEQARQAEDMRKQLEKLLQEAQAAAEKREQELQEAATIEKEVSEVSGG